MCFISIILLKVIPFAFLPHDGAILRKLREKNNTGVAGDSLLAEVGCYSVGFLVCMLLCSN